MISKNEEEIERWANEGGPTDALDEIRKEERVRRQREVQDAMQKLLEAERKARDDQ